MIPGVDNLSPSWPMRTFFKPERMSVARFHEPVTCIECGKDYPRDQIIGSKTRDVDCGGHIERRVVGSICASCMTTGKAA